MGRLTQKLSDSNRGASLRSSVAGAPFAQPLYSYERKQKQESFSKIIENSPL